MAATARGLRRVATFNREVAADKRSSLSTAADDRTSPPTTTAAATATDLHGPIATAAGGYGRGNSLTPAEHHVRAVRRRLHPHAPCTSFSIASHRNILGGRTRWPAMLHEACVIETVAASHVVSVLLSERV